MRLLSSLLVAGISASALVQRTEQQPLGTAHAETVGTPAYRDDLLALHKGLIETSSTTGAEGNVGDWLVAYLEDRHYKTHRQQLPKRDNTGKNGRFNVIAWIDSGDDQGDRDGLAALAVHPLPPVLVTSHIDVVPPHIPYAIDDKDSPSGSTVIHGRGSVDAKGSVAAQITALEQLRAAGVVGAGDVLLLFVVGEEDSGDGMKAFSALFRSYFPTWFAAAIFGEPTENKLACGHKGILGCTVTAAGKAGHSGYPWLGKSANDALVRGLAALLDADLGSSPVYGNTTVNVGLLSGGVAANVIPAAASAKMAVRVALGPQATGHDEVRARMEAALQGADKDLALRCTQGYGVVECDCAVEGFANITVNYGTDVPNLDGDHTRYLYGPGDILVAHGDKEALTVGALETAVRGYEKLIRHALGRK
ncbi:acetylornithine deacetylase [Sporothrix schenckii 1099-18]|uniref:Acetylornithine deacetylase n=1 Tax=Sporothrix schenckii 1099-18 TaxID=1397361 RepID=A0A0F2M4F2_SPOSC|nr:acetylornithine deacetylase [Sporothrix schenckii 1099-18]KJR83690.1 acetylornithine deacetylase [Sporothrix schenckii 1099-18]